MNKILEAVNKYRFQNGYMMEVIGVPSDHPIARKLADAKTPEQFVELSEELID